MKFKVPFTVSELDVLRRRSKPFLKFAGKKEGKLNDFLKASGQKLDKREYISICFRMLAINLTIYFTISFLFFVVLAIENLLFFAISITLLISVFIFFNQINYPRAYSSNLKKDIEKNLLPALQDMLVQLSSGISIFSILYHISSSDYGALSEEFKKIVKEINAGIGQVDAIENHGKLSTSRYFRRILWQISNAMRAGGDMTTVIKEEIKNLSAEQVIQIQSYGSRLNPLIMFYLLIAVILPALGITFIIILSSMVGLAANMLKLLFVAIFFIVSFIQIIFLGIIKSRRPSLL